MGLYVQKSDDDKVDFLKNKARILTKDDFLQNDFNLSVEVPMCLMDNGAFMALAVGFSAEERKAFCDPKDTREKLYCAMPIKEFIEHSGISIETLQAYASA